MLEMDDGIGQDGRQFLAADPIQRRCLHYHKARFMAFGCGPALKTMESAVNFEFLMFNNVSITKNTTKSKTRVQRLRREDYWRIAS